MPIVVSWFFSPVFTGTAALLLLLVLRTLVLRRKNAYMLSFWVLPPAVLLTVFICVFVSWNQQAPVWAAGCRCWVDGLACLYQQQP